jgi:hypothetical protein
MWDAPSAYILVISRLLKPNDTPMSIPAQSIASIAVGII